MSKKSESFLELSNELDLILEKLQNIQTDIDDATSAYERGAELINKLEDYLKNAQNKVEKINQKLS